MVFPRSPQHRFCRLVQSFCLRFDQYQFGLPLGIFCIVFGMSTDGLLLLWKLFFVIVGLVLIGRFSSVKAYYERQKGLREIRRKRKEIKAAKKKRKEAKRKEKNLTPPA